MGNFYYKNIKSTNDRDEFYTPAYAVHPIIHKLKSNSTIWCPFDTADSNFVIELEKHGHNVIYTHIWEGDNFFEMDVPECDYIISNPPWSKKNDILEKLFEIGKPFAMLFGVVGMFDSNHRFTLFEENDFGIMMLYPRVQYTKIIDGKPAVQQQPLFQSCYVTSGIMSDSFELYRIVR